MQEQQNDIQLPVVLNPSSFKNWKWDPQSTFKLSKNLHDIKKISIDNLDILHKQIVRGPLGWGSMFQGQKVILDRINHDIVITFTRGYLTVIFGSVSERVIKLNTSNLSDESELLDTIIKSDDEFTYHADPDFPLLDKYTDPITGKIEQQYRDKMQSEMIKLFPKTGHRMKLLMFISSKIELHDNSEIPTVTDTDEKNYPIDKKLFCYYAMSNAPLPSELQNIKMDGGELSHLIDPQLNHILLNDIIEDVKLNGICIENLPKESTDLFKKIT